jgi:hypothetical protein
MSHTGREACRPNTRAWQGHRNGGSEHRGNPADKTLSHLGFAIDLDLRMPALENDREFAD